MIPTILFVTNSYTIHMFWQKRIKLYMCICTLLFWSILLYICIYVKMLSLLDSITFFLSLQNNQWEKVYSSHVYFCMLWGCYTYMRGRFDSHSCISSNRIIYRWGWYTYMCSIPLQYLVCGNKLTEKYIYIYKVTHSYWQYFI